MECDSNPIIETPRSSRYVAHNAAKGMRYNPRVLSKKTRHAKIHSYHRCKANIANKYHSAKRRFNLNIPNRISDVELLRMTSDGFLKKSETFSSFLAKKIRLLALEETKQMLKIGLLINLNRSIVLALKNQRHESEKSLEQIVNSKANHANILKVPRRLKQEIQTNILQILKYLDELKSMVVL